MKSNLSKGFGAACAMAALLALGGCGERSSEATAGAESQGSTHGNMTAGQMQAPAAGAEAALRSEAQRTGATELAQGEGT